MVDYTINLGNCLLLPIEDIKSLNVPPFTTFNSILPVPSLTFFLSNSCILQIATKKSSTIPIWVAPKPKYCKQSKNVFYDDCRFPDETDDYDNCVHSIKGGIILQRKRFSAPQLDVVDPEFHYDFDETLHGTHLATARLCIPL
jgi:hypothetical protein